MKNTHQTQFTPLEQYCTATPGDPGEMITLVDAGKAHSHWLKEKYGSIQPEDHDVIAVAFGKVKLTALLERPGCVGLRFYFSKSRNLVGDKIMEHLDLIAVPYNEELRDLTVSGGTMFQSRTENSTPINHISPEDEAALTRTSGKGEKTENTGPLEVLNTSRPCPNYCSTKIG
jgi:hypothetical protein